MLPKHLLGEPDTQSDHGWILRTSTPPCLIRVREMIGGPPRICVTHFTDVSRQPAGKLLRYYTDALLWFERATGEPEPTRSNPEIITDTSYKPPEWLILDNVSESLADLQTWLLHTPSACLLPVTEHLTLAEAPFTALTVAGPLPERDAAVKWLADYAATAALTYLGIPPAAPQ